MPAAWKRQVYTHRMQASWLAGWLNDREPTSQCLQASFVNAKLHNADWTRTLIGEYPSLKHDSSVNAVAVHGAMTVTGCKDSKIRIWKDGQVPASLHFNLVSSRFAI